VSTGYDETGRVRQKQRTRQALVEATQALLVEGVVPTVEQAAAAARISRTTAYRYFPSQRALLAAARPEIDEVSLLPPDAPPDDPRARLAAVIERLTGIVAGSEAQQRAMLRLSLEAEPEARANLVLRQGRAIGWIEEALAPLAGLVPEAALRRLVLAVRAATGIESFVWLTDVAGLSPGEATATQRWSAEALLTATLAEHDVDLRAR
jgi:AcrR family transcriptional regulator